MSARKTFLYFAYGSNLLTERIHINNPSAVFKNIAKLPEHQLDFNYFSQVTLKIHVNDVHDDTVV